MFIEPDDFCDAPDLAGDISMPDIPDGVEAAAAVEVDRTAKDVAPLESGKAAMVAPARATAAATTNVCAAARALRAQRSVYRLVRRWGRGANLAGRGGDDELGA